MKWPDVIQITFGMDVKDLPPAVSTIAYCLLILIFCLVMHRISSAVLPDSIKLYVLDYFKCLAFCSYPLGYGLTRKYHGHTGYCLVMVPFNVASLLLIRQGCVNPVENFLDFIKGRQPLWKSLLRIIIQLAAGISAFYLAKMMMVNLEFHGDNVDFAKFLTQACTTDLKIPVALGFLLELVGTAWETCVWSQKWSKNENLNLLILSTNTAIVVSLGVHYTGMYVQPALATGYKIGCHGETVLDHLFVYWVGPFIGGYLAYTFLQKFHPQPADKDIKKEIEKQPGRNQKVDKSFNSNHSKLRHRRKD